MVSSRRPPSRMPAIPWSQPGMTWPAPSWNANGSPRSHEASNSWPLDQLTPTYCMLTWSPALAFLPLPLTMSLTWSSAGGWPDGFGIVGFLETSFETAPEDGASVGVAVGVAVAAGADDASFSLSLPHAATPTASSAV